MSHIIEHRERSANIYSSQGKKCIHSPAFNGVVNRSDQGAHDVRNFDSGRSNIFSYSFDPYRMKLTLLDIKLSYSILLIDNTISF